MSVSKLKAIVLAGGTAKPEFAAATGVTNRALAELAPGRTMLSYVLQALRGASRVGEVVIVGDVPEQQGMRVIAPGKTLVDNIQRGIQAHEVSDGDKVLLVSSDIPFIKPNEVEAYIALALASGADFCYPIIPMKVYRQQFGQMKRTTLRLREGEFTGGNIMLVRAGVIRSNSDAIHKAYAARKSPLALGRMLGWSLLTRIAVSQIAAPNLLTIALLESAISRLLGGDVRARAVITSSPSLGTDIDQSDDIAYARQILAEAPQKQMA